MKAHWVSDALVLIPSDHDEKRALRTIFKTTEAPESRKVLCGGKEMTVVFTASGNVGQCSKEERALFFELVDYLGAWEKRNLELASTSVVTGCDNKTASE